MLNEMNLDLKNRIENKLADMKFGQIDIHNNKASARA